LALTTGCFYESNRKFRYNKIYEPALRKHNLKRISYPGDDYHVTLGFVENVDKTHVQLFKVHVKYYINDLLKGLKFKFGTCSTLASKYPFIVAFPSEETHKTLCAINKVLHSAIEIFNALHSTKYALNELTHPDIFVPHLSLNGQYGKEVSPPDISKVIQSINQDLRNIEIPIDILVID
jgi:hypothetical protein